MTSAKLKHWRSAVGGCALWLTVALPAQALAVFACEPEWAALVRELAPQAQVRSATHARQDPHHIEARPSLIAALRRADLAVCTGAELEAGWLPMLQQRAGNPQVRDRAPGMFYASDVVELIDPQPEGGGPFAGDVHAAGNPHLQLDPRRLLEVAEALNRELQALDPPRQAQYQALWAAFDARWRERIRAWEHQAAPLKGMRVAAQHSTFAYLWHWLGIEQVADLEPLPGMPPTPGHLRRVLEQVRHQPPQAVVAAAYQDPRSAQWLAQQIGGGAPALRLPATVDEDGAGLDTLFDTLIEQLLAAARQ